MMAVEKKEYCVPGKFLHTNFSREKVSQAGRGVPTFADFLFHKLFFYVSQAGMVYLNCALMGKSVDKGKYNLFMFYNGSIIFFSKKIWKISGIEKWKL